MVQLHPAPGQRDAFCRSRTDELTGLLEDGDFVKKLQIFQAEYAKLNQQLEEPVTLSIGYATGAAANEEELRKMIQLVDNYLYQAKRQGKNQVVGAEKK
ncbi:diguanylate cyclase domain-containing protein [Lactobacillus delbrueckii]|uniref:diguanylate cyclase domain-containing protein n=1 Tax=Lactobacillus delbrueckii TaxID=1584 RepID=UPI0022E55F42|nr:diguanylate cyclase [Lactobacillus delbrueckii]